MSLFVCMECGCVENTNCNNPRDGSLIGENGFPNMHTMEMHGFRYEEDGRTPAPRVAQRMLCSECNTGTWHGEWEKSWPTEVELAMAMDLDDRTYTSHPLFKGSYNDLMDSYTLEQFEADNAERKKKKRGVVHTGGMLSGGMGMMEIKNHYADDHGWMPAIDPFVREEPKVGRNEPCPCGSGKKYKRCCYERISLRS